MVVNTKERQRHIASFGITVKEGFHGQGIGKALMNTLIDLADNWLNLHRIELTVYTDNDLRLHFTRNLALSLKAKQ